MQSLVILSDRLFMAAAQIIYTLAVKETQCATVWLVYSYLTF